MNEMLGWVLDLYADEKQGLVLWHNNRCKPDLTIDFQNMTDN